MKLNVSAFNAAELWKISKLHWREIAATGKWMYDVVQKRHWKSSRRKLGLAIGKNLKDEVIMSAYNFLIDALSAFDGGRRQVLGPKGTAGIWATYPKPFLSIASGIADQVHDLLCH